VQHFILDPAWDEGCPVCSYQADSVGPLEHLHARNTTCAAVSRAPIRVTSLFCGPTFLLDLTPLGRHDADVE
jgi:predicted dithiol-disulfide oxidoreductase (DUF899 family)